MPDSYGAIDLSALRRKEGASRDSYSLFPILDTMYHDVRYDQVLYPEDIAPGKQVFPQRFGVRQRREDAIERVLKGNYSDFIEYRQDKYMHLNIIDRFNQLIDKHMHTMLAGELPEVDVRYDGTLRMLLKLVIYWGLARGRALVIELENDGVKIPDPKNSVHTPNGIVYLIFSDSPTASGTQYTTVTMIFIDNGMAEGYVYEVNTSGSGYSFTNADPVEIIEPQAAKYTLFPVGNIRNGGGTSIVEANMDIAVQIAQCELIIDYILARNSEPILTADSVGADIGSLLTKMGVPVPQEITDAEKFRRLKEHIMHNPFAAIGEGLTNLSYLEYGGELQANFMRYQNLNQTWTLKNGQVMMESGDASELAAGVALARREASFVVRNHSYQRDIIDGLMPIVDLSEWEVVDPLNSSAENVDENAGINQGTGDAVGSGS